MTTAHFGILLAQRFGARLKSLDVTFTAPVFVGDPLRLVAKVESVGDEIVCALSATKPDGTQTARGTATIRTEGAARP